MLDLDQKTFEMAANLIERRVRVAKAMQSREVSKWLKAQFQRLPVVR